MRLFILPHTCVGVYLVTSAATRIYVYHRGTSVTATIDQIEPHRTRRGSTYYLIWYHYMLDGRRYDEQGHGLTDNPAVGKTFEGRAVGFFGQGIFYLPEPNANMLVFLVAFAIFWNFMLAAWLYVAWVIPRQLRWLPRHGEAVVGTITEKQMLRGKGTDYKVSYSFEVSGQEWSGGCAVDSAMYEALQEGMAVTVLFDPSRPERNLAYELSDFVVREDGK